MRLSEINDKIVTKAIEDIKGPNYSKIYSFYKKYKDQGMYLLHGRESNEKVIYRPVRFNRTPKDTSRFLHNFFDRVFGKAGFKATRSNSLFCTGDPDQARAYGNIYIVFPSNDFEITWSEIINDFTDKVDTVTENILEILKDQYYDEVFQINQNTRRRDYFYPGDAYGYDVEIVENLYEDLKEIKSNLLPPKDPKSYKSVKDFVESNPQLFQKLPGISGNESFYVRRWIEKHLVPLDIVTNLDYEKLFPYFVDNISSIYIKDNLYEAINSNVEIMVYAKNCILIDFKFFQESLEKDLFE